MSISDHLKLEQSERAPQTFAYIDNRGHIIIEGEVVL